MNNKDQLFFIKRLAFLIAAGMPLSESLEVLSGQASARQQKIFSRVAQHISLGFSLTESLRKEKLLTSFAHALISAGEHSGNLAINLSYLAGEMEKRQAMSKKIIAALIYPAVVVIATFGIAGFLIMYLFPKIAPVFASMHTRLPISTRLVIGASTILGHFGWYICTAFIMIIFLFFYLKKKYPQIQETLDYLFITTPFISSIIRALCLASLFRTFGLLLKSGMPTPEALPIALSTTAHSRYTSLSQAAEARLHNGESLAYILKQYPKLFPEVSLHLIEVGERTGSLSDSLLYLSSLYESEVDDFSKNLGTLIEPVLMITMGVVVGFIAISIITPIYSITQSLHP